MDLNQTIKIGGLILTAIAIPFIRHLYLKYIENRPSVFFEEFDKNFTNLNEQLDIANILLKDGKLSSKRIKYAHEVMFRKEKFISGVFRDTDVTVVMPVKNNMECDARLGTVIDKSQISSKVNESKTFYQKEISIALAKNIRMWNKWIKKSSKLSEKSKIDLASRFHTYLMVIHPFFDGNGRLGRRLLSEQLSYLFERHIEFTPESLDYYTSINNASGGDETLLKQLITKSITGSSEEQT